MREDVSELGGRERAEPVAAEREGRQMLVAPLLVDDEELLVERQRPPRLPLSPVCSTARWLSLQVGRSATSHFGMAAARTDASIMPQNSSMSIVPDLS